MGLTQKQREALEVINEGLREQGVEPFELADIFSAQPQQPSHEDPLYEDYLDQLEAERETGECGSCTCDEALEAMHDLEPSCRRHS